MNKGVWLGYAIVVVVTLLISGVLVGVTLFIVNYIVLALLFALASWLQLKRALLVGACLSALAVAGHIMQYQSGTSLSAQVGMPLEVSASSAFLFGLALYSAAAMILFGGWRLAKKGLKHRPQDS